MPHFSEDLSAEDPETLRRLRTLLHGQTHADKRLPTMEERFASPRTGAWHGGAGPNGSGAAQQPRRARRPATT